MYLGTQMATTTEGKQMRNMPEGWVVKSVLSDEYGTIEETLSQGLSAHHSFMVIRDKVNQYDGSLWNLTNKGPRTALFVHEVSGATLRITAEVMPMAVATKV